MGTKGNIDTLDQLDTFLAVFLLLTEISFDEKRPDYSVAPFNWRGRLHRRVQGTNIYTQLLYNFKVFKVVINYADEICNVFIMFAPELLKSLK